MAVEDWSQTPAENTSLNGLYVGEGCAASAINDAIRQIMASVRADQVAQNTAISDAASDAAEAITNTEDFSQAISLGTIAAIVDDRVYETQAALYADLVPADDLYALVTFDADPLKNGLYRKNGATTTGSWEGPSDIYASAAEAVVQPLVDQAVAAAAKLSPFAPTATIVGTARTRVGLETYMAGDYDFNEVYYLSALNRDSAGTPPNTQRLSAFVKRASDGTEVCGKLVAQSSAYTGIQTLTLDAMNGSGITMTIPIDCGGGEGFTANTGTSTTARFANEKIIFASPTRGAAIEEIVNEVLADGAGRNSAISDASTDDYAKSFIGDGIVINGDPEDSYYFNYRTDNAGGTYRIGLYLYSVAHGAKVAQWEKQNTGAAPTIPERVHLTLMADGTQLTGDRGIEGHFAINSSAISYTVALTTYTNATATGIKPDKIRTTDQTEATWRAPAMPRSETLLTVGATNGEFNTVVDAVAALCNVNATISRTTYPASETATPEWPAKIKIVDPHNEQVTPFTYLGVDQSTLRLPHGTILETLPDTLIWMNTPGNTAPVIEMSFTSMLEGGGEIKQFGSGYVIHVDNGNAISRQTTGLYVVRKIQTRFGRILLHKVPDSTVPIIGSGLSDGQAFIVDGTRFLMDADTSGAAFIGIHTSPNAVIPGLIDIQNAVSNCDDFTGVPFLSVIKAHAQDFRHGVKVANSDCPKITQGNTVVGDGTSAGFVRLNALAGITLSGISLEP